MTERDPLERLGALGSAVGSPDLDAIKLRAHRIRRRRQTGLASAGAAAMAIVAVVGVLLVTGPGGEKASSTLESALSAPTPTSAASRALGGTVAQDTEAAKAPVVGHARSGAATSGGSAGASGSAPKSMSEQRASSDTMGAGSSQGAASVKPPLEATLEVADQMIGRGKTFTLKVCNTTSGTVSREFGSSQRYDFEVSQGGDLVWRWSDGQFFTQVVGEETWKGKECKEWSADWDGTTSDGGRAPAGDYTAVGILKTQPELRTAAKSFSLAAL